MLDGNVRITPFLQKLWKLVNDPETDELIRWSDDGNSFFISNSPQFFMELLPLYFKHNNMSSFVRQLNLYGFHKVVDQIYSSQTNAEFEYVHPCFLKGKPSMLKFIKRTGSTVHERGQGPTSSTVGDQDEQQINNAIMLKILTQLKELKKHQDSTDKEVYNYKQENGTLWREVALQRQKLRKQQQLINKLIQFIVTWMQQSRVHAGAKRNYPLMITEAKKMRFGSPRRKSSCSKGATICEVHSEPDDTTSHQETALTSPGPSTSKTSRPATTNTPPQSIVLYDDNGKPIGNAVWENPVLPQISCTQPTPQITHKEALQLLHKPQVPEKLHQNQTELPIPATSDVDSLKSSTSMKDQTAQQFVADDLFSDLLKDTNFSSDSTDISTSPSSSKKGDESMTVAMYDPNQHEVLNTLNKQVENNQNELDQFKDLLSGYDSVNVDGLLSIFNDDDFLSNDFYTSMGENRLGNVPSTDDSTKLDGSVLPTTSSELTPYRGNAYINLLELLEDVTEVDAMKDPLLSQAGPSISKKS